MIIRDGDTGKAAKVNGYGDLRTNATISTRAEFHSLNHGDAYTFDSTELDIDAGDTMLFIKNIDPSKLLMIDRIIVNGSNVNCTWDINVGSATTTPTGTAVTPVNLNRLYSSTNPSVLAYSDETAVADGTTIFRVKTLANSTVAGDLNINGLILPAGHYIQINQETESTSGSVIIVAHFENMHTS